MHAPFGPPSSIISRDHENSDGSGQSAAGPGISPMQNLHTPDLLQSRVRYLDPQRPSSSGDTILDSLYAASTLPPSIDPSNHANIKKRATFKPYQRPQANASPQTNTPSKTNAPPQAYTPTEADFLFAERFLAKYPDSNYIIDDVLEGKESFEQGMENMPDGVIAEAILTKKTDCKAKRMRLLATVLETEATQRHVKLLYKLREDNSQMYTDNPEEAFRIEGVLVRRSLEDFEDDLGSSTVAHALNMGAFTAADLHLDVLKEIAAARNLSLSEDRLKDGLEANLAGDGNSSNG